MLDAQAIEQYWSVQDALARGDAVDAPDWDALFETPAYRWQAGTDATRRKIRDRMKLAFQPDRRPIESALAEAEGYDVIRWEHHLRIRDERDSLGATLEALTESTLIEDAIAIARRYVPADAVEAHAVMTPIRLLFFAPDAIADDGVIYLDLVHAKDRGEGLVRLLAHEFHHEIYTRLSPFPGLDEDAEMYWVLLALTHLHMEGLADRIDKISAPLMPIPGLPTSYIEQYNEYYQAAPAALAAFDTALVELAHTENRGEAALAAWNLFHLNGHPEGFYMANTIAAAQGDAALLEDVGDPFAFVRRFQSVRPVFSDEALDVLTALEAELLLMRGVKQAR